MKVRVIALFAALLLTIVSTSAQARLHHRHVAHHRTHHVHIVALTTGVCEYDNNGRVKCGGTTQRVVRPRGRTEYAIRTSTSPSERRGRESFNTIGGNELVAEARKYIGTNPTGRGSLWCGAFMDMVLKHTGHPGGGNLASAYANYGVRVSGPQVGAIAVMGRRGGGHVGVVSGIDANGNPVIISGNTRLGHGAHTTLEHAYPRGRIYAYVVPR